MKSVIPPFTVCAPFMEFAKILTVTRRRVLLLSLSFDSLSLEMEAEVPAVRNVNLIDYFHIRVEYLTTYN